ncbi:MAG: exodeoxyribonuclease III [Pseudanabaenaceae cyanobacterium]
MRIATWNVNSIRARLEQVLAWLGINPDLDLLCLQETKVEDEKFPMSEFQTRGYFVYAYGQKTYNGTALISKHPLNLVQSGFSALLSSDRAKAFDDQKRLLSGVIQDVRVVNLYVPNGSAVDSEKFFYKLAWLELFHEYLALLLERETNIILCGDFNVALSDLDIHDPTDREIKVMATDRERQSLRGILDLGFVDVLRHLYPEQRCYTWWDYRGGSFRRNLGWRIDYHLVSNSLLNRVQDCTVDVGPRKNSQPSDHAPVILTLKDYSNS